MTLPECGLWKTWKDMVANECIAKHVKACLIDIGFAKIQNGMGTQQGKYCLSISLAFGIIGA